MTGATPDEEDHVGKFAILLEPIADGKIGVGCLGGVCPVKIDVEDEDHGYADIADAEAGNLKSCDCGAAQILWKEDGTGTKWAVVRLGVPPAPFRYVELAVSTANLCYLETGTPAATHPGEFQIYFDGVDDDESDEIGIIKFDRGVGDDLPIERLVIDIGHSSSGWETGVSTGGQVPVPPTDHETELEVKITPITEDFEPTDLDYTDYSALSKGTPVAFRLLFLDGVLSVNGDAPASPPSVSGEYEVTIEITSLMPAKDEQFMPGWDSGDIHGVAVELPCGGATGGANALAYYVGTTPIRVYGVRSQ